MGENYGGLGSVRMGRRDLLKTMGVLAGAGAALSAIPGCSSSSGSSGGGGGGGDSIVVYSTTLPEVQADLAAKFTEQTGIKVKSLRLATGLLSQRFLKEQQAGQYANDILTLGDELFIADMGERGLLSDISGYPGVSALPDDWKDLPYSATLTKAPDSIGYNTDLVSDDQVPREWTDLLRPEFKGQIILPDPRNNQVLMGEFFLSITSKYGEDFVEKLGRQDLILTPTAPPGLAKVAAGDAKLVLATPAMNLTDYVGKNAPVDVVAPAPSPTNAIFFYLTVPKHAPNPEGARKWVEFVLSETGQELVNNYKGLPIGASPLGPGVKGSLPPADSIVKPSPEEAKAQMPKFLRMMGLGS